MQSKLSRKMKIFSPEKLFGFFSLSVIVILILLGSGCARKTVAPDTEVSLSNTTFSFDQGTYPSDIGLFPKYRITAGDVLDVLFQIRREKVDNFPISLYHTVSVKFVDLPELNEEQEVLPNGKIHLPYLGGVQVEGKTASELENELKERYSNILRDPELYVTIPDFNARIRQLRNDLRTSPRGLSKLVNVRPDGYATFPIIGEKPVAQKTVSHVNEMIEEEYQKVLPGMQADLFLHEKAGSVLYVTGEVANPGRYEIDKPITTIEALATAGGATPNAELRDVVVFRKHEGRRVARSLNLSDITSVKREGASFYLKPDDLVYVPQTRISSVAQLMQQLSQIVLFSGWSYGLGDDVDWIGPNPEETD